MDFALEAELAGIVDNDVNQSENYQLFYKLDRRCRDLEKENVSLKQQLLKDRETFEKEKEQLLLKQSELYAISAQFDVFKAQIKDLFGVECATADDLARAVSQTDRHTRTDSSRKALAMKDQRIEKLEAELREIKSLYEKTESDNAQKSTELAELTKKVGKQFKRIETLRALLSSHLELTGAATVEASLDAIRGLRKKVRKYRDIIKEQVMTELKRARGSNSDGGDLKDVIAQQAQIIEMVVKYVHDLAAKAPNEPSTEFAGHDLSRRKDRLTTSMQVHHASEHESEEEPLSESYEHSEKEKGTGMTTASVVSDSDGSAYVEMKQCVWLNKTRELLALERQLVDAQRRMAVTNLGTTNNAQIHAVRHPILSPGKFQTTYL